MAQVISKASIADIYPWDLPKIDSPSKQHPSQSEQNGYRAGYQKGLEEARKIAKEEFRTQVSVELQEELTHKLSLVNELIVQLEKPMLQVNTEVEGEITKLLEAMLIKLVQRDLQLHPEKLRIVVQRALKLIPEKNNAVTIYLARDDIAILANHLVDLVGYMQVDDALSVGDFKITVKDAHIDGTVKRRVENLISSMQEGATDNSTVGDQYE